MTRDRKDVVCDVCKVHPWPAIITCGTHQLDLCESHMRRHFDRETCRLVPVKREPSEFEAQMDEIRGSEDELTEMVKLVVERLRKKDEGAGQSS